MNDDIILDEWEIKWPPESKEILILTYIGCWYGSIWSICLGSGIGAWESVSVVSSAVSSVDDGDGCDLAYLKWKKLSYETLLQF